MPIFLTNRDVDSLVTAADAVQAARSVLRDYGLRSACNQPRFRCMLPNGLFRAMLGTTPALDAAGVKQGMWLSSEEAGATSDVERRTELVSIYSLSEAQILAIINSSRLNELRTAGGSGVATDLLARPEASVVGVLGSGPHALAQLEAVCAVRDVESFRVYSRNPANRERFVASVAERLAVRGHAVAEAAEATADADIIIEATFSRTPVLTGEMVAPGTHVNSIGSSFAGKQVLDDSLLRRVGRYAIDFKEQALHDSSGDVIGPIARGIFSYADIVELGDLAAGTQVSRTSSDEITLYKSIGFGLFDVAVGKAAYDAAERAGVGLRLPEFTL